MNLEFLFAVVTESHIQKSHGSQHKGAFSTPVWESLTGKGQVIEAQGSRNMVLKTQLSHPFKLGNSKYDIWSITKTIS